ncbi:hypothetical protein MHBO_000119 [Bonamia ostreae]|uniref:Uncharacterized protein n=1 Tax=Bonamia ostreae TaxID=126728 RepID=A0ABV2AFE5_9EUKA
MFLLPKKVLQIPKCYDEAIKFTHQNCESVENYYRNGCTLLVSKGYRFKHGSSFSKYIFLTNFNYLTLCDIVVKSCSHEAYLNPSEQCEKEDLSFFGECVFESYLPIQFIETNSDYSKYKSIDCNKYGLITTKFDTVTGCPLYIFSEFKGVLKYSDACIIRGEYFFDGCVISVSSSYKILTSENKFERSMNVQCTKSGNSIPSSIQIFKGCSKPNSNKKDAIEFNPSCTYLDDKFYGICEINLTKNHVFVEGNFLLEKLTLHCLENGEFDKNYLKIDTCFLRKNQSM